MKIRSHGTEDECHHTAAAPAAVLDALDTSGPYPHRPLFLVRTYLSVTQPADTEEAQK